MSDSLLFTLAYVLIVYHAVLVFCMFRAKHNIGFSLSIGSTIITHIAILAVVVGMAVSRHHIPFFGIIRWFLPGFAPFEVEWLFHGEQKQQQAPKVEEIERAKTTQQAIESSSADDYEEWMKYLAKRDPNKVKRGLSVKEEYVLWLAARAKARQLVS